MNMIFNVNCKIKYSHGKPIAATRHLDFLKSLTVISLVLHLITSPPAGYIFLEIRDNYRHNFGY